MIVTLLSDYGTADTYVGQMKGALLALAQHVTLVDLTHAVPPQDVRRGAFHLWAAVEPFPPGSLHVAVVDPGVGSVRKAIAVRCGRGDLFVGPDNGLLVPAIERLGGCRVAVELTERAYWRLEQPSNTFHGRDIFAPVAGYLAAGVPLERVGETRHEISRPFELRLATGLSGEVVHVDGYGNLVTNIPANALPARFQVRVGERAIEHADHYAAVERGALLALGGSGGLLEISVRDGNAHQATGAGLGTAVHVEPL